MKKNSLDINKRKNKQRGRLGSVVCLAVVMLLISCTCVSVIAAPTQNWYFGKKGNSEAPSFPMSPGELEKYNAVCIDSKAYERGEKIIYLTFDAGYENGNVVRILDVLQDKNVSAAFFILSNLIIKEPELVKRMAADGHLVCNHTSKHKDMTTLSDEEMMADLGRVETLCKERTGVSMAKIFRFPEGRYSEEKLALLRDMGYRTVFWSAAHADWDNAHQPSADAALKKLKEQTHPGAVFLLHPTSATNAAILSELIDYWRNDGYTFGRIDEIDIG